MAQNNEEMFLKNLNKEKTEEKEKKPEEKTLQIKDSDSKKNQYISNQDIKNNSAFEKLKELTKIKQNEKKDISYKNKLEKTEGQNIDNKNNFNSIKSDEKLISYKTNTNENDLLKKKRWENSYEEEPFEEIVPIERKDLIKINEFEWEKEYPISKPKEDDFYKKNEKENKRLNWLKQEIDGKKDAEIIKQKRKDDIFPWEATQKISAPTREDFINEINKEQQEVNKTSEDFSKQISEFSWEKRDKNEEPNQDDFNPQNDFNSQDNQEKNILRPKWLNKNKQEKNKTPNTQQTTTPKWKHPQNNQTPQTTPKWLNKNKQEKNKTPNTQQTTTPKWKHKNIPSEEKDEENREPYFAKHKIETPIDIVFELLEKFKTVNMSEACNTANINYYELERIMKTFEDYGIVSIEYPTSLSKKPSIILLQKIESKMGKLPQGEILDDYSVVVDNVPAQIKIITTKNEARPIYGITMPSLGIYTKKFLNFIKNEIAETIPVEMDDIIDPKKSKRLKERFFLESQKHLANYFKNTKKETLDVLSGIILHEMYGLGDIEIFLGDDMLEEVAINSSKTPLTVYHRIHGWIKTNFYPGTEEEINNYSSQIGRKVGREITTLSPILDAHLLSGDRVNATLFPISSEGNTLTIRRFARRPWTLIDFIGKAHTMNSEMAALLWLAMQYEMNIIVSGGTASGKTSTLNTLLALVPPYHRIISIEDVREIILPKFLKWNWVSMVTRSANPEGLGEVTMLDCMVSSLRMRPDRIIVGEIRRKKEAEVMMEAIETGHSIYSTIHANSAYQVLRRLGEAPMSIPPMQIELIDLVVTQFRDRKTNKRRTYEIAEIEQTSSGKGLQVNTIYKWAPRTDTWDKLNRPTKLLTLLNIHTGLTESEIEKDLKEREKILGWLVEKNINDIDEIGFIIKKYYIDKNEVLKMADEKMSKEQIREMI